MLDREPLLENPIFTSLEPCQLNLLISKATIRGYARDEWIVHLKDDFPYLLFVCQGKINALKESIQGRTLIVVSMGPGEVFWGPSFFLPGTPNPVALMATETSQLLLWRQSDLLPILMENGQMSWELARHLVQRMLYASDFVQELAFQPVKGRLARLLLDLYGDRTGQTTARDLTLDEMAAHINTTREMVCKQLAQFADNGAIEIQRTAFRITDRAILERTAREEK